MNIPVADTPTTPWEVTFLSERAIRRSPLIEVVSQAVTGFNPAVRLTVPWQLATSDWVREVGAQLARLSALGPGWDSYHARPLSQERATEAVHFLSTFLDRHSEAPALVPLSDGGVQLEWHSGGVDVEISFPRDDVAEMYVHVIDTGQEWSGALDEIADETRPAVIDRLRHGG